MAGLQQRQTDGNQEVIRAVLYDKMNSCYALWYLERISLNTHRYMSNPHSIQGSLNKLKSAVSDVNYTDTWSPRRQANTTAVQKQRFRRPNCKARWSLVQAVYEDTATTPIIHLKLLRVPVKYCVYFSSSSKPLIKGMKR